MPLRIRRGTDAERLTITPLEGELVYTTDTKLIYVGDGTTVGGVNVGSGGGSIGGVLTENINLNGFDIEGIGNFNTTGNQDLSGNLGVGGDIDVTGNILVGGTITAQGNIIANGNITLGNGNDIIVIAGDIDSNLLPGSSAYTLGANGNPWGKLYVNDIEALGIIQGDLEGSIVASDSSLAYNYITNTFSGGFIGNLIGNVTGNLTGDLKGNILADDSSLAYSSFTNSFQGQFYGNHYGDTIGNVQGDLEGSIIASDSSLAYNYITNSFQGQFYGNHYGETVGDVRGDLYGNIYAFDSTLRVSALDDFISNGNVSIYDNVITSITNKVRFGRLEDILPTEVELNMPSGTGLVVNGFTQNDLFSGAVCPAIRVNTIKGSTISPTPLSPNEVIFAMNFQGSDTNGNIIPSLSIISLVDNNETVGVNSVPGKLVFLTYPDDNNIASFTFDSSGRMAINKYDATETLDVEGNGLFSGNVTAAAFKGSFVADDSSIIVDGVSGAVTAPTVTASTFVQFPVYTDPTARDAAISSPAAGMVVFVTDSTGAGGPPKLQANTNGTVGGWVDL